MILPTREELDNYNMGGIHSQFRGDERGWVLSSAGVEHYRLLRYLGSLSRIAICELGTYMGHSAAALGADTSVPVFTYDYATSVKWHQQPDNVFTHLLPNEFVWPKFIVNADVIFVDTWHHGKMEREVFDYLLEEQWTGILVYDDIDYNDPMREFWASIPESDRYNKIDLTNLGHCTGTGVIEFL